MCRPQQRPCREPHRELHWELSEALNDIGGTNRHNTDVRALLNHRLPHAADLAPRGHRAPDLTVTLTDSSVEGQGPARVTSPTYGEEVTAWNGGIDLDLTTMRPGRTSARVLDNHSTPTPRETHTTTGHSRPRARPPGSDPPASPTTCRAHHAPPVGEPAHRREQTVLPSEHHTHRRPVLLRLHRGRLRFRRVRRGRLPRHQVWPSAVKNEPHTL